MVRRIDSVTLIRYKTGSIAHRWVSAQGVGELTK
jgi:hypothetical protein